MSNPSRSRVFYPGRRTALAGWAVALLVLLVLPAVATQAATAPERVVAVGDVHGEFDALVGILQQAGLIDSRLRWMGGRATLVQTGDLLDRGPKSRPVMDLFMALEKQAQKKGGRVVVLLGNHEVMNLTGDLRYVSREEYASYADAKSEARQKDAYRAYLDFLQARTPKGQAPPAATPESEKAWMDAHPLGFLEHREAFAPAGKYGWWLRQHAALAKLDDLVFLHGGLNPTLASWSLEAINNRIHGEINAFDTTKQYLVERKVVLSFFTLEEMTAAAQAELQARQEERERRSASAPAAPEEERHLQLLQAFLSQGSWFIFAPDGPLWYRGFAQWSETEGAAQLPKLLASLGASGFVVGHTPQADGRIHAGFGGRVFLIDTGMLSRTYTGGRASALEIRSGTFTAIYPGERTVLLDRSRSASPAGDEGSPRLVQEPASAANSGHQAQPTTPAPASRQWTGPDGKPLPFTSEEQLQEFLRTAKLKRMREIGEGITKPRKVLLEKNGIQMNAIFRDINESKPVMAFASGRTELQFRDSFLFEPAAFELSRLLGLDNVPPTTVRRLEGKSGSIQVWIENAMTEGTRKEEKISPPDNERWNNQMYVLHVFDALVYNTDRNLGNVLIDRDWKVWMIDHTRAFRRFPTLDKAAVLNHCEAGLFEKLRTLDEQTARERLKKYLSGAEIDALLKRRRELVEHFQKLIQEQGEVKVLYRLQ